MHKFFAVFLFSIFCSPCFSGAVVFGMEIDRTTISEIEKKYNIKNEGSDAKPSYYIDMDSVKELSGNSFLVDIRDRGIPKSTLAEMGVGTINLQFSEEGVLEAIAIAPIYFHHYGAVFYLFGSWCERIKECSFLGDTGSGSNFFMFPGFAVEIKTIEGEKRWFFLYYHGNRELNEIGKKRAFESAQKLLIMSADLFPTVF